MAVPTAPTDRTTILTESMGQEAAVNPYAPLSVGLFSHQGSRSESNDDSCDFFTVRCGFPVHAGLPTASAANGEGGRTEVSRQLTDLIYVAVIADGVSTSQSGKEASRIATATIRAHLEGGPQRMETISEWLEAAVQQANDEIAYTVRRQPEHEDMSTTVVVAAIVGIKLYAMHLGDSRAYLLRRDRLFQLTRDHTWTEEAVASGTITVDEAAIHPARNQLRRFLGSKGPVRVDRGIVEPTTSLVEEYLLLNPGDAILLCTDGVHSRLSESEVWQVIQGNAGYPQDSVEELVAVALGKGERDDITSILIELPLEKKAVPTENTAADTNVAGNNATNEPDSFGFDGAEPEKSAPSNLGRNLLIALAIFAACAIASYQYLF